MPLAYTSEYYIIQTISGKGIRRFPGLLEYVTTRFIRQEIRSKEAERYSWVLKYVSTIFQSCIPLYFHYITKLLECTGACVNMCI